MGRPPGGLVPSWLRRHFPDRREDGSFARAAGSAYGAAGVCAASLTVTDNSDSRASQPTRWMYVAGIAMSSEWRYPRGRAKAVVTVMDYNTGSPISGATVTGHWTGAWPRGTVSAVTDVNGNASFITGWMRDGGTWAFRVDWTTHTDPNTIYHPELNVGNSDSVTYAPFG